MILDDPRITFWVEASAGTGKTSSLVNRYKSLIEKGFSYKDIVCITFTNNAAAEMKERIKAKFNPRIQTIHSLAHHIVSIFENKSINIIEGDEKEYIINKAFYKTIEENDFALFEKFSIYYIQKIVHNIFRKTYILNNILNCVFEKLSSCKFNKVTDLEDDFVNDFSNFLTKTGDIRKKNPKDINKTLFETERDNIYQYVQSIKIIKWLNFNSEIKDFIKHVYKNYIILKKDSFDYQDIIIKGNEILKNDFFRYKSCGNIKHILLDEAQDTNPHQWNFINLLTNHFFDMSDYTSFFAVGDPKQSIYGFQDSHPYYFENQMKNYMNLSGDRFKIVTLKTNYRSLSSIVDFVSDSLFIPKQNCVRKNIDASDVKYIKLENIRNEIDELIKSGFNFKDIMILVRKRNSTYYDLIKLLDGLPLKYNDEKTIENTPIIRDFIAFFEFIMDSEDEMSLFYILQSSLIKSIGINPYDPGVLSDLCIKRETKLIETIKAVDKETHDILINWIENIKDANEIFDLFKHKQYINDMYEKFQKYNITDLFEAYKWLLNFPIKYSEKSTQEENAINLMTIHASKGLQSKIVFICTDFGKNNMKDIWWSKDDFFIPPNSDIKHEIICKINDYNNMLKESEDKRLLYVGYTRAEDKLYIF